VKSVEESHAPQGQDQEPSSSLRAESRLARTLLKHRDTSKPFWKECGMIDFKSWRKPIAPGLLAVVLVAALAACSGDTPTSPSGSGGDITPPDDTGSVTLMWDAPTTDADGSGPLIDLVGYTVCYGVTSNRLDNCAQVGNVTSVELQIPAGTYFFAVRAVDTWGNQSDFSNVIQVTVEAPGATVVDEDAVLATNPAPEFETIRAPMHASAR
jgi:hypothetical protein